jgi:hypothetical protein
MEVATFATWGWRIPFLLSIVLLVFSVYIRLRLRESPVFQQMRARGKGSKAPLTDSFLRYPNNKLVLLALLGATAGQGVVWYTGQFYALFFLTISLRLDDVTAYALLGSALLVGTPFFVFFGWLSDKIGRKPIIMTGCALAALLYFPLFGALTEAANPALAHAQARAPITVIADPDTCSVQFDPIGKTTFDKSGCDIAKSALAKAGIPYANQATPGETVMQIGEQEYRVTDKASFDAALPGLLAEAGYPAAGETPQLNTPLVVAILTVLVLLVTMVYGPIAALLVELFPSRIRYTAMSLPYHIGNGWFGGFLPTIAFAIVAATGNIYAGLWYPVGVAVMTLAIGVLFLPETYRRTIDHGS